MTEGGPDGVRPIAELFRGDCVALWATTYNVELNLFNEYLLRRLGDSPLNAVVLADRRRLDESLASIPPEWLDTLGPVNRRWLLRGLQVGTGRFHPKSYLAVRSRSATLMVGSGNLSTYGIDAGREVFTAFTSGTPIGEAAIASWRTWMRRLVEASGDTLLAERFADLEQRLPKAAGPIAVADSPLWHNLDRPFGSRFCDEVRAAAGPEIDELIVTAPYFDEEGVALGALLDHLRPKVVRLYFTSSTSVAGSALASRLTAAGCEVQAFAYQPDRFTHAKLVGAVAGDRGWLLSGSANLSRAALMLGPGHANVELGVFSELTAGEVQASFLPPGVEAMPQALESLQDLTYESGTGDPLDTPIRLTRATIVPDGRVGVDSIPEPTSGWLVADHHDSSTLEFGVAGPVSSQALAGPLVRLENPDGQVLSNWAVLEDLEALSHALAAPQSGGSGRPVELTSADLDTPLGRALLFLHRNLVMDVSEIPTAGSGQGGVDNQESTSGAEDDDLWDRLERETLGRDPRAGTYGRLLAGRNRVGVLTDPVVELLDLMRDRAPVDPPSGAGRSLLARLIREHESAGEDRPKVSWSLTARLRVRTRNVLRRWASAQSDPRLAWVDPLAPLGNLRAVAAVFTELYLRAADVDVPSELEESDLDDLWARWFTPFVGTGHHDGWLDRAGLGTDELRDYLGEDFVEACSALCWLAVRPGPERRERRVHWQSAFSAALGWGLIDDSGAVAEYVSIITGHEISPAQISDDFLETIEFMDDRLWCELTAQALDVDSLRLEGGSVEGIPSSKVTVNGVADPLHDPRVARLVIAVRSYRRVEAVAVYAADSSWRIVLGPGQPAVYLSSLGADAIESAALSPDDIERLAAGQGVLADLFPRVADVA